MLQMREHLPVVLAMREYPAIQVAAAMRRFVAKHHRVPTDLRLLVPEFLPAIPDGVTLLPVDPLVYRADYYSQRDDPIRPGNAVRWILAYAEDPLHWDPAGGNYWGRSFNNGFTTQRRSIPLPDSIWGPWAPPATEVTETTPAPAP